MIKHDHGGAYPACACGCGQLVKWRQDAYFHSLVRGHHTIELRLAQRNRRLGKKASLETREKQSAFFATEEGKRVINSRAESLRAFHASEEGERWAKERSRLLSQQYADGRRNVSNGPYDCGRHFSPKTLSEHLYRSSYEKRMFELLDSDDEVIIYRHEPCTIMYEIDGVSRRYIPDVLVEQRDGSKTLIEVKPRGLIDLPVNVAKRRAAESWCSERGICFKLVTELELGL